MRETCEFLPQQCAKAADRLSHRITLADMLRYADHQKEIVSFCDTLMNDGVPEEQIRACLYEEDEKALVSWIEGGRVKTYYYVVDEEVLEM